MVGQIINKDMGAMELNRKDAWNNEGQIILCVIPKKKEFVTWYLNPDGDTISGRYFTSLEDALANFEARI